MKKFINFREKNFRERRIFFEQFETFSRMQRDFKCRKLTKFAHIIFSNNILVYYEMKLKLKLLTTKIAKKLQFYRINFRELKIIATFREINFRESVIFNFSRDKLSRKRTKFAKLAKVSLAKVSPINIKKFTKLQKSTNE